MKIKKMLTLLCAAAVLPQIGGMQTHAVTERKLIALTFDDGPNTTTTNAVLDLLEQYDARASFFLIGDNINDESAVSVKRAYDMGCEIDNHSKSHSTMTGMSEAELLDEITYVDEWVCDIIGEHTRFFRPPFIAVSQSMYDTIDMPFICGYDCRDFMENVTAAERADAILSSAKDGMIYLLHDAAGNDQTVEALKTVIPELQAQGYELVTLTELFAGQGETPKRNLLYSEVAKYPCADYTLYENIFTGNASGESSWSGWGETAVLDAETLTALGESYAVQVDYESSDPPVIALQKWSGTVVWDVVQPAYFNGARACFLAADILAVLDSYGVTYGELDKISVTPYGGTMTVTQVDLLVKGGSDSVDGDVNADGVFTVADVVALTKYLVGTGTLGNPSEADRNGDRILSAADLTLLKRALL